MQESTAPNTQANDTNRKSTSRLSKDGKWRSFPRIPHLLQYVSSGTYYARVRIGSKLIRRCLGTTVFSTAKLRLLDFVKENRELYDPENAPLFSRAAELFEASLMSDTRIKESSKHYRHTCIRKLKASWPELWRMPLSEIGEEQCRTWAVRLRGDIAAQYFNNVVDTLRLIIEAGIKEHLKNGGKAFQNPAKNLSKAHIPVKALNLPERDQFRSIVDYIRQSSSWGPMAGDLVEFLAYSGLRLYTEAQHLTWEDIDWQRKELIARGSSKTATKNWDVRRIPLLPNMETLLAKMKADREARGLRLTGRLLEVRECPISLRHACEKLGLPHLRHHDLRHLFATRCIESGVDIPTVARWLGHKDGGALAMKTYGHLRNEHSQEMARKVRF